MKQYNKAVEALEDPKVRKEIDETDLEMLKREMNVLAEAKQIDIADIDDPKMRKYFEQELRSAQKENIAMKGIVRPKDNTQANRKLAKKERKIQRRLERA